MAQQATDPSIHKTITVDVPQERAFAVFAEEIGSWWPLAGKSIGAVEAVTAVIEPAAGGRWFERGRDGSECEWGRVIAYEPSDRLVLDWQIAASWTYDSKIHTEVGVRFIAESEGRTRVELEHRGLQAYGDQAEQIRAIFESTGGWGEILGRYAAAAAG